MLLENSGLPFKISPDAAKIKYNDGKTKEASPEVILLAYIAEKLTVNVQEIESAVQPLVPEVSDFPTEKAKKILG